jgi:hypothetical protein
MDVYHFELRAFPHNLSRFNLSLGELRSTLLEPWIEDRVFECGERSWDPRRAKLTVLQGPRLDPGELTMGRGWRLAQRRGRDVTAEVLVEARAVAESAGDAAAPVADVAQAGATEPVRGGVSPGEGAPIGAPRPDAVTPDLVADSLGLELLAAIGTEHVPLGRAWALAQERSPGSAASVSLALAERAVMSLLGAGLVVLLRREAAAGELSEVGRDEVDGVLRASESWGADAAALRRA